MPVDLSRQADMLDNKALGDLNVLVIGCGGVGSPAVAMLISMGVAQRDGLITLYDPDTVGAENIGPQYFDDDQKGQHKVEALAAKLTRDFALEGEVFKLVPTRYVRKKLKADVVIIGVDKISYRRKIWEDVILTGRLECDWWIDGRMGGTSAQVWCVPMDREDRRSEYYRDLQSNVADTNGLACGRKSTAPLTKGVIPGMIGQCVAQITREDHQEPNFYVQWDIMAGYGPTVRFNKDY